MTSAQGHAPRLALGALLGLIALSLAWELWLAPLRPGGSMLVVKAAPLLLALPGLARRRLYTMQWAAMLVLLYLAEGIVRGMTERAPSCWLGWGEAALSTLCIGCILFCLAPYKRRARRTVTESGNR
jgi:uncharacterized membrane protein